MSERIIYESYTVSDWLTGNINSTLDFKELIKQQGDFWLSVFFVMLLKKSTRLYSTAFKDKLWKWITQSKWINKGLLFNTHVLINKLEKGQMYEMTSELYFKRIKYLY